MRARTFSTLLGALAALALAIPVGPAQAKQVYDYVYSGQFIDGSGSDKGAFPFTVSGLAYDSTNEDVLVAVGGEPSYLTRFTKAGAPDPFDAPGLGETIVLPGSTSSEAQVAVDDNSGGPGQDNVYAASGNEIYGFAPDGTPLAGFAQRLESLCGISVNPLGGIWASRGLSGLRSIDIAGNQVGEQLAGNLNNTSTCQGVRDGFGDFYVVLPNGKAVKLDSSGNYLYDLSPATNAHGFAIDGANNQVFSLEGNTVSYYDEFGAKLGSFGAPDPGHSFEGLSGNPRAIAVDLHSHDVWVANRRDYGGVSHVERFVRSAPITVPGVRTGSIDYGGTEATLRGTVDPDGVETTDCHFDWGPSQALAKIAPCTEGNAFAGSGDIPVSAALQNLTQGTTYYYRLSSTNANGRVSTGGIEAFVAQGKPLIPEAFADVVNTDGVRLNAKVDPNGGNTTYRFEYGTDTGYGSATPEKALTSKTEVATLADTITGLSPGLTYHYRLIATNEFGTTAGPDHTFTTYAPEPGTDTCPNAAVRQQTSASLLLDCRAYELASAANAGGFDVESTLIPGQEPLLTSPSAVDRLLYSVHSGSVPGVSGHPTNFGRDPYLAKRTATGWQTDYVGLPADGMAQQGAFGSPLLEATNALDRFAFGGTDICDPCFGDGSTNIPMRGPDGAIAKGMTGSLEPAGADPSGTLLKRFSADGSHFLFGSTSKFEPLGKNGFLTIYDRDLTTGVTQVVSTLPNGTAMGAGNAASLDISADGSRVVVATKVGTDAKGNELWHPYLHVGTNPKSTDLAPTTTTGVYFDGISADGSRVFMSTTDKLLPADSDESADIYEALIDQDGKATLSLLSTTQSGPSNDDSCTPPGIPDSWNSPEGDGKCNALAFAGAAGVAENGSFYFLSPELLDGPTNGEAGEANLYRVEPGGKPGFVAVMDSSAGKAGPQEGLGVTKTLGPYEQPTEETPMFVSVDNSGGDSDGDVYVADAAAGVIKKYDPAGNPVLSWGNNGTLNGANPAVVEITIRASAGHWKATVAGQSTPSMLFSISPAELQAELEKLSTVDPGDVTVVENIDYLYQTHGFILYFQGQYSPANAPVVQVTNVDLTAFNGGMVEALAKPVFGLGIYGIANDASGRLTVYSTKTRAGHGSGAINAFYGYAPDGELTRVTRTENAAREPLFGTDPAAKYFYVADNFTGDSGVLYRRPSPHRVYMDGTFGQVGDGKTITAIEVDLANGDAYVARSDGNIDVYSFDAEEHLLEPGGGSCEMTGSAHCPPTSTFAEGVGTIKDLAIDASTHHVYVDLGDRIVELNASGAQVGNPIGLGELSKSTALAVHDASGTLYASTVENNQGYVKQFGIVPLSWNPIDNPAILHAVGDHDTRRPSDFQASPDGRYAAFGSAEPLKAGFDNRGHEEIYRYDASQQALDCASCPSTGASPSSETRLSDYGRNLADDGRLFFTSSEPYVLRDTNREADAYEWSGGAIQLISTGQSPEGSELFSVSAEGTDAFFYTRETLVGEDANGATVKVYDARAGGGFARAPTVFPCAASDECHGAGSQPPAPPAINTVTGSGKGVQPKQRTKCKKGKVRRHGKCAKPRAHKRAKRVAR